MEADSKLTATVSTIATILTDLAEQADECPAPEAAMHFFVERMQRLAEMLKESVNDYNDQYKPL